MAWGLSGPEFKLTHYLMAGKIDILDEFGLRYFKACSDADVLAMLKFAFFDEAYCTKIERLDAEPGYVSSWTLVKKWGAC